MPNPGGILPTPLGMIDQCNDTPTHPFWGMSAQLSATPTHLTPLVDPSLHPWGAIDQPSETTQTPTPKVDSST